METDSAKLIVDADACPVTALAVKLATAQGLPVLLVCDTSHVIEQAGARTIVVSKQADSADFAILQHLRAGDIVLTQDYGLAALALSCRAYVINQNGMEYTNQNIDDLLLQRHIGQKIRRAGGRTRGPAPRTQAQNEQFAGQFTALLARLATPK